MLVGTIAAIDHRYAGELAGQPRRTLLGVTHHHGVGVRADDLDRVSQGFTLLGAGIATIGKADDVAAQPLYCGLERQAGTGGRFKETAPHQLALQQVIARRAFELARRFHDEL